MIYQLGKIEFKAIEAPTDFSIEESMNFIEKPRLVGLPTLEVVGGVLNTISFTLLFHYQFCNVRESIQRLRDAMRAAKPLDLIDASGYSYGEYVITRIRQEVLKADEKGVPIRAEMSVDLLEYFSGQSESSQSLRNKKDGFASIKVNPVQVKPKSIPQLETGLVMRDITTGKAAAAASSVRAKKVGSIPALAAKNISEGARYAKRAKDELTKARSKIDSIQNKITNSAALKSTLDSVISNLSDLSTNFGSANASNLSTIARSLDINLNQLSSVASQLATIVATRQ